jgi:hypothetical protein
MTDKAITKDDGDLVWWKDELGTLRSAEETEVERVQLHDGTVYIIELHPEGENARVEGDEA